MALLILLFPLLNFLSCLLFGNFLTGIGCGILTTFGILITFLFVLKMFYTVVFAHTVIKWTICKWVAADALIIHWSFCFDTLTAAMLSVVVGISLFVHLYSISYMAEDPHLPRFMSYLSLFTFFMVILVTANNFLQMFVGWEGVGVCSFLLINFWYTRIQANKAAIKAMLVNRIGDFFILLALFLLIYCFNTLEYDNIFSQYLLIKNHFFLCFGYSVYYTDAIAACLFLGAMGKSAQLGLHTWLPDAMEGPTPVSALIHAATMVTAGVFLLIRCSLFFEQSEFILDLITAVGALTAIFAATIGLFQNDLKRIIAYSTCSQLGYMIFACGLSNYEVALFHLSNHAVFKALLFLGAGAIIHSIADEQDIRRMGGLKNLLPFSYVVFFIASFALIGFPFLAGFYSKDVILEVAYIKYTNSGQFAYFLGLGGAFCTAFYSSRLFFLVFLNQTTALKKNIKNLHESSWPISFSLFILVLGSLSVGYFCKELYIGFGTHIWQNAVYTTPTTYLLVDVEFITELAKIGPLVVTLSGVAVVYGYYAGFRVYSRRPVVSINNRLSIPTYIVYTFLLKKWYVDRIYNTFLTQYFLNIAYQLMYKILDRGIIETNGPTSVESHLLVLRTKVSFVQTGLFFHYILYFFFAILFVILCFLSNVLIDSYFLINGLCLLGLFIYYYFHNQDK